MRPRYDADAPLHRQQVALQRGAHAKGNHRHAEFVGQFDGRSDVLGTFGKDHRGRWRHLERRFVSPMLFTHGHGGGAALAKQGLELFDQDRRHLALGDGRHQVVRGRGRIHGGLRWGG